MRSKTKRNLRVVVPAVAAAGLSAWLGVPTAHATINLAWINKGTSGGNTIWVLTAQNDGLIGPQQVATNTPTGTGIVALDLTLSTPGSFTSTAGAIFIDLNADIDGNDNGDGTNSQRDADVTGQVDQSYGTPTPSFGKATGTFIGYNDGNSGFSTKADTTPNQGNEVYVNDQTYANYTQLAPPPAPTGSTQSASGNPAIFETKQTPDNLFSELDPAFVNGTVHSLEMIIQDPLNDTVAHPIANLVIPTGTIGTALARVTPSGSAAVTEVYTLPTVIPVSGPSISLTSSSTNSPAGTVTMVGGNGGYVAQNVTVPSGAQVKGALTVNGFNPASDNEIYVLAVDNNGALASGNLTSLVTELQTALKGPSNGVVSTFASLPASIQALFPANTYNLAITFPTGNGATAGAATVPDVLAYDFSDTGDTLSITNIGVVPEPTGVGVLVLGGIGLMARRRRISRASA